MLKNIGFDEKKKNLFNQILLSQLSSETAKGEKKVEAE